MSIPENDTWQELVKEISEEKQIMVVLNTRKDALSLIETLGDTENIFHLSTLLCGIHRRKILREVKRRLNNGLPVRLISTQVIEAGVDIDFPVVYRATGPLDRIVQAVGRCNREGKLPQGQRGRVVIFEPSEGRSPKGPYKTGLEKAKLLLAHHDNDIPELHNPELYRTYFEKLFADVDTDKKRIQAHREILDYPTVDAEYRLIEKNTVPVLIDCDSSAKRLKEWNRHPCRRTWQRLQPLLVNMFDYEAKKLKAEGWLEPISDGLYFSKGMYDKLKGLVPAIYDPSDLIQ